MSVLISVRTGDITQVPADVLIAPANPQLDWFGRIDDAIRAVPGVGTMFHEQLRRCGSRHDGKTVWARPNRMHSGAFNSVLFVIDCVESPLGGVVDAALNAVNERRLKRVSLPLLRTGQQAYVVELIEQAIAQLALSVFSCATSRASELHIQELHIVVHPEDEVAMELLRGHMRVFQNYLKKMRNDDVHVDIL